ncbi:TPA: hypothetical protein ACY4O8_001386 [Enterobacter cloacae]
MMIPEIIKPKVANSLFTVHGIPLHSQPVGEFAVNRQIANSQIVCGGFWL